MLESRWIERKPMISKFQAEQAKAPAKKACDTPASVCDHLDSLNNLKDGWDSYSAPAPSRVAIENAKALAREAETLGMALERAEPSAIGGVGITFASGQREVVIEFYNNGTAHALVSDDETADMSTQAVPANPDGYQAVLGEVRKYLYGE
jgi:hypothetical protein